MSENLNEIMKQSESVTKTKANIDTPTIVMSVETESTEKTGVQPNSGKEASTTFKISFNKCCMRLCSFFRMSSVLFFFSIAAGIAEILLCRNSDNFEWKKVFIGVFSILSLILSVVVKLKTDEEKCLKVMLLRSFIESFDKKDISIKEVEGLKNLLNSIEL